MKRIDYRVSGMTCGHCAAGVTAEVNAVPGVTEVSVDLKSDTVRVTGTRLDDALLRSAIERAGYEAASSGAV
ncbi:heavy-metal-associated domain-containing protein [Streptomyces sp. NPDC057197]|uniref:heavy-metal-associated domain-containing protein n=1 Tax=unclassified Streptomyces TaxID=2593676 RepID=UPI0007DE3156|nr:heavy-metal-associated domain-containing protein [Streptomyces sp. SAT1]ANH89738.1 transporter [Streptomyces sp. SAT1]